MLLWDGPHLCCQRSGDFSSQHRFSFRTQSHLSVFFQKNTQRPNHILHLKADCRFLTAASRQRWHLLMPCCVIVWPLIVVRLDSGVLFIVTTWGGEGAATYATPWRMLIPFKRWLFGLGKSPAASPRSGKTSVRICSPGEDFAFEPFSHCRHLKAKYCQDSDLILDLFLLVYAYICTKNTN